MMTTANTSTETSTPRPAGPSVHVGRARTLLLAGLAGGLVATVLSLVVAGITHGSRGLLTAAVSAGIVLGFYVIGQLVMVFSADAGARTLMIVSMTSYAARVILIGMILIAFDAKAAAFPQIIPLVFFLTAVAVVIGWLGVEIVAFSRLRIGAYDTEYVPPSGSQDPS